MLYILLKKKNNNNNNSKMSSMKLNYFNIKAEFLSIYKQLYPLVKGNLTYEENSEIDNKTIRNQSTRSLRKLKTLKLISFGNDEGNERPIHLTDKFLNNLIHRPLPLNKQYIEYISKFILSSELILKIQGQFSSQKFDANELSIQVAKNLQYIKLKKGKVLFKIGDIGDKFFFILKGTVSILKLKPITDVKMDFLDYLSYCMFLLREKEDYILNEVLKTNYNTIPLSSDEYLKKIYKIIFVSKLQKRVESHVINNTKNLIKYFDKCDIKPEEFEINIIELEKIEIKNKKNSLSKEWENYVLSHVKSLTEDVILYEQFKDIIEDDKIHLITCFKYDVFLYLDSGSFFGDFALDSDFNRRNATIRAEEDTFLGWMQSSDYINVISPKRKVEKMREMYFLYSNYFFKNIGERVFEKNYFHLFSSHRYNIGTILFNFGMKPKNLFFLENGQISLELQASIIDIQNLIKFLVKSIFSNQLVSKLSLKQKRSLIPYNTMRKIQKYAKEKLLAEYKGNNERYLNEIQKIQNFRISILNCTELVGIEEIYLKIPYIMKGVVITEKISCFEINIEHLRKIIIEEKQITYNYIKHSINKILSLIERLQTIKQTNINLTISKLEKDFLKNKLSYTSRSVSIKPKNKKSNIKKSLIEKKNVLIKLIRGNSKINEDKEDYEEDLNSDSDINYNNSFDANSPVNLIATYLNPLYESMLTEIQKNCDEKNNTNFVDFNYTNIFNSNCKSMLDLNPKNQNKNLLKDDNQIYITLRKNTIRDKLKSNKKNSTNEAQELINENSILLNDKGIVISNLKKRISEIGNMSNSPNRINVIQSSKYYYENCNKRTPSCSNLINLINNNNNHQDQNNSIINKKFLIKSEQKYNNFHLSYVPLNILSAQSPFINRKNRSKIMIENSTNNNTVSTRQSAMSLQRNKFYGRKINKRKINISKSCNSNSINQVNLKYNNKTKKIILPKMTAGRKFMDLKLNLKQKLVPEIVKNYYQQIKKRGYSSIIINKDNNTYLNRGLKIKSSHKENNSDLNNNEKINQNLPILPKINSRYSSQLSAISVI